MKKVALVLSVFAILVISYYRYTYFINLNFAGEPIFIKVRQAAGLMDVTVTPGSDANVRSILVYWLLFLLGNAWFSIAMFRDRSKAYFVIGLYLAISGISVIFFALNWLFGSLAFLSTMASMLKNLVLSPVFTAGCYLVLKYKDNIIKAT